MYVQGTRHKLTPPEVIETAIGYYAGGLTSEDAARRAGIATETLRRRLRERRLTRSKFSFTPREEKLIARRYARGDCVADLASAFSVNRATIVKIAKRNGVRPHRGGTQTPARTVERIVRDYGNGTTISQLGRKYGLTLKTVRKHLLAAGVLRITRPGISAFQKRSWSLNHDARLRALLEGRR